jgi:hypothetical protein
VVQHLRSTSESCDDFVDIEDCNLGSSAHLGTDCGFSGILIGISVHTKSSSHAAQISMLSSVNETSK